MTIRAALLSLTLPMLLPSAAFGQKPSAEVDQALRARANEFFQYFVDGQYRKAYSLVAEEAQDEFFGSPKAELKEFKIDNIKYNDSFSEAIVNLMVKRVWKFQGQEMVPEVPMSTTWKVENGKWVWYNKVQPNTWVTAMGPSDVAVIARKPDGTITGLPDKMDQAMVDAAGARILQQDSGFDKSQVKLSASQSSSETVIFHNAAPGSVGLELVPVQAIPGLSAKLDKTAVNFGENTALHIQYDPVPGRAGVTPPPTTVTVVVQPFRQQLTVQVSFDAK
jgi:hypothetical protein